MPAAGFAKKLIFPGAFRRKDVPATNAFNSHAPPAGAVEKGVCPYANTAIRITPEAPASGCPFHAHKPFSASDASITQPVPLAVMMGSHQVSQGSANLLQDIGGGDRIREICTRFYARMHEDTHLRQFLFLDDGPVHHGQRLADWIIEKMGGEGKPWTDSGRHGQRQPSHRAAWYSARRGPSVRGQRFKLDDCRMWMRLHFWAAREAGLDKHTPFFQWYKSFIAHFIAVYERRAPAYAEESAQWSANEENIKIYLQDNTMHDVIGPGSY
eukprot:CAMPEP_0117691500 /NCGR_PEP_ID=MMETSP0804-20121206/25756_1 /TAXON_ID=1074897 /ORGANISM="Tetraselmis astigmatica, Strain CCMP880" /LENGTH=268 /DNA_ID=CAMNT_0005504743 /DNA_START=137 /DNA_END=943 /DNA_ORIENTATION=+